MAALHATRPRVFFGDVSKDAGLRISVRRLLGSLFIGRDR